MPRPRRYWTVGTRDFRTVIGQEFHSEICADRYRSEHGLEGWVLISVDVALDGNRKYASPEQPDGPVSHPAAGSF